MATKHLRDMEIKTVGPESESILTGDSDQTLWFAYRRFEKQSDKIWIDTEAARKIRNRLDAFLRRQTRARKNR